MHNSDSQHNLPKKITYLAVISVFTILLITVVLLVSSLVLQIGFASINFRPIQWINNLDQDVAFDIVANAAELLAAVLAIAITVIAIIVELAANRYSHRITSLFVREPANILIMSFFVIATVYSIWIAMALDAKSDSGLVPGAGLLISIVFVSSALIILLPYFAYVMTFLSPVNVIEKIRSSALDSTLKIGTKSVNQSKTEFLNAVDELQDIARRSAELSDRTVEMASINAFLDLILEYQGVVKHIEMHKPDWFKLDSVVRNDPDFVSINENTLDRIEKERLWAETKILRQYLDLISDSNPSSRDTSYLIAINTRKIALESTESRGELELVRLCIQCFNSYLRATITNNDPRTGYYIMNQYRMLAESLLSKNLDSSVKEIATHLHFYGLLGFNQGLPFLLEVAAEDICELAMHCGRSKHGLTDQLMKMLLDLDREKVRKVQEESLIGVRRAQVKLALFFLDQGDHARIDRICEDLRGEKPERLAGLLNTLETETRSEYWEFTDRGSNFTYLDPQLRSRVAELRKRISITTV